MSEEKKNPDGGENQDQVMELTMKGLEELIQKSVKDLINDNKSVMPEAKDEKAEVYEKGFQFIKDLVAGNVKAIDSTTSSFGYTVPTELADKVLEKRDKLAKMRKYAFSFKMSGAFQVPKDGTAVTAYWVGENTEITEGAPTTGKSDLVDYYLGARVLIPRKLLSTSAVNVVEYVANLCGRAIRNTEETAFVAGDGSSKPTGVRGASFSSVAQAGASLAYDDIVNGFYGLAEQYRVDAVWLTSSAGMKAIRKIKDSNGVPIFDPKESIMFDRPVLESSDIPSNLGSGGDETEIILFSPSFYWIKDGEDMFMEQDKVISKLQTEVVLAEAVDGVMTLTDAGYKITGVV